MVVNPCDHEVEVRLIEYRTGGTPGESDLPTLRRVRAHSEVVFTSVYVTDFDVDISAPELGWSVTWTQPQPRDDRTFAIPLDVCME